MKLVVDAGVAARWFFENRAGDKASDTEIALEILHCLGTDSIQIVQPVNWLHETFAIIVQLNPAAAAPALKLLQGLELPIVDDLLIQQTAAELATRNERHFFDTLYHAVAIETDATLITSNRDYYEAMKDLGHITMLGDFVPPREALVAE